MGRVRFTTAELVAEAKRELTLRKRVYPNRVFAKRMSQRAADRQIALMIDIIAVLEAKDEAERLI
jgi:hypothetical protein